MNKELVSFGKENHLIGVLTEPKKENIYTVGFPIIILLNAGIISRVGPNGIYSQLAKNFAEHGFTTLRFDFSGMGDSIISKDDYSFNEYQIKECIEAIDFLQERNNTNSFILMGLCSGADICFKTALVDQRIVAIVPVNGYFFEDEELLSMYQIARKLNYSRYYQQNLFSYKRWIKIMTGKSNIFKNITKALNSKSSHKVVRSNHPLISNFQSLLDRKIKIYMIYSIGSTSYDLHLLALSDYVKSQVKNKRIDFSIVEKTDHLFTLLWSQQDLSDKLTSWINSKYKKII